MAGQRSLLLSLAVALFSSSSVWAEIITLPVNDTRLVYTNKTSNLTPGWQFYNTGVCGSEGGTARTDTTNDPVSFQFNGTAAYVVFAEYDLAGLSSVTIDGVQANVTARNTSLALESIGCHTRTLYATNMTNTNHTVTVAYVGSGLGSTVLNKFMFDDGADTPRANPTATRLPVTIQDTAATATSTSGSTSRDTGGGLDCIGSCKGAEIGGVVVGVIVWLGLVFCIWKRCCRRKVVRKTVYVERPTSPEPQTVVVVAAHLEVQQTHIHVEATEGGNSAVTAPPAYAPRPGQAQEQTNFR